MSWSINAFIGMESYRMNVFKVFLVLILIVFAWAMFRSDDDALPPEKEKSVAPQQEPKVEAEQPIEEKPEVDPLPIQPVQPVQPPSMDESGVEATQLGSIRPLHKFGDIYLAGQPAEEDIALLKEKGVKTVLNFRRAKEMSWDEKSAVEEQGMQYVHLPFQGVQELTPEIFSQALEVLRDDSRRPILIHCGSSNRVGAIWYAFRVLEDKLPHEEASAEARTAGLRTEGYLKKARDYLLASELLPEKESSESELAK